MLKLVYTALFSSARSLLPFYALLGMAAFTMALSCPAAKAEGKLNVLFIAIDDLQTQLGCYGDTSVLSPNIDRLAGRGLLFERAYCQQAICSPSRISMLSGLRPDSTGIYGLTKMLKDELPEHITLPQHFKRNGYETVSIGKIYHHSKDDPKGWSTEPFRAMESSGYITAEGKRLVAVNVKENPAAKTKGPPTEMADVEDNVYSDGKLADFAVKELNRLKDQPFFIAVGFRKPHLPFTAPKKYWDLYDPEKIKLADNPFRPKGATKYTMNNFGELRNYYGMVKGKDPVPDDVARHLLHGYAACVSFIDAQVGKILDELERLDLRDNTVVILWSDHGWKLGEHASWAKHTNFDIDARVPMIISAPGMKAAGRKTTALTELVDIYPTLSDLCGLPIPSNLEGHSYAPLLDDPDLEWKSAAFHQYPRDRDKPDKIVIGYAMRTQDYHYIEWKHIKSGKVQARELYDHRKDPDENVNVIDNPEYSSMVKKLAASLKEGWRAALP